jgi:hypothetical protein
MEGATAHRGLKAVVAASFAEWLNLLMARV